MLDCYTETGELLELWTCQSKLSWKEYVFEVLHIPLGIYHVNLKKICVLYHHIILLCGWVLFYFFE